VDEAGRGPLAGPVVASAVIVRDFSFSGRIDDSKKMTPEEREAAYDEILAKCSVGVSVFDHAAVDALNIFRASMSAMEDALAKLAEAPDCVLVDGPHAPGKSRNYVPLVDGDAKSLSIACASIVAKVTRDRIMRQYDGVYPGYGFAAHKGYFTREHVEALNSKGPCEIHRRSFAPVRSLLEGKRIEVESLRARIVEED
jgi:ribonuclease HII